MNYIKMIKRSRKFSYYGRLLNVICPLVRERYRNWLSYILDHLDATTMFFRFFFATLAWEKLSEIWIILVYEEGKRHPVAVFADIGIYSTRLAILSRLIQQRIFYILLFKSVHNRFREIKPTTSLATRILMGRAIFDGDYAKNFS